MQNALDIVAHSIVIGAGATAIIDLWAALLWRIWRLPSLDFALLGRWIGHFRHGQFRHDSIGRASPIKYERVIGWTAHYTIGVTFAAVLLAIWGLEWLERPTLIPPLVVSSVTLAAPFFLMQPAMGAGIAASRTPRPNIARLRSVVTHTLFGLGLYASAWVWLLVRR